MNKEFLKAVQSLISDIETMQNGSVFGHEWFGPFSEGTQGFDGDYRIEWPNLAISLAAVKKLLEPLTIEGELSKPVLSGTKPTLVILDEV